MPKVNNLCWRGGNPEEGHNYISYGGPPTAGITQWGGGSRGCNGLAACFCFLSENPITYGGS